LSLLAAPDSPVSELWGEMQIGDLLAAARRRKWWVILTAMAATITACVVAWRLPNIYRSETVILVDPQKVPDAYVTSTVSSTVLDRLPMIRQEVMSPTRLKRLVDSLGLYPELRSRKEGEQIIQTMQKAINIEVVDAGAQRLSAFRIAFHSKDAKEASTVANQLAGLVIEENLKSREQQFSGTEQFLESELQDTKRELERKEADLQRIKTQNVLDLPESKQYHVEALNNLRNQLRASQDKVDRTQQEKVYLQSLLASTSPVVDLDADTNGPVGSPMQSQIQKTEARLSELRSRYGQNHPDVRREQARLNDLKAKAATEASNEPVAVEQPKSTTHRGPRNPVVEAQLEKLQQDIDEQEKLQAGLQEQINSHSSKLERGPVFEQQMAGLMRDYDTLRTHYDRLLDKKLSAEMASQLESRQQGERFVILDSAPIPQRPFGPNRLLISLAGLMGGLLGGVVLAMVAEMADESVRNEREASELLGKGMLAGIPSLLTTEHVRQRRLRLAGALVGTAVSSVVLGLLISLVRDRLI
jgi:succinoglycan biosynthesis transport protein ExoP